MIFAGTLLAPCWHPAGTLLAPCWHPAGTLLAPCWHPAGTYRRQPGPLDPPFPPFDDEGDDSIPAGGSRNGKSAAVYTLGVKIHGAKTSAKDRLKFDVNGNGDSVITRDVNGEVTALSADSCYTTLQTISSDDGDSQAQEIDFWTVIVHADGSRTTGSKFRKIVFSNPTADVIRKTSTSIIPAGDPIVSEWRTTMGVGDITTNEYVYISGNGARKETLQYEQYLSTSRIERRKVYEREADATSEASVLISDTRTTFTKFTSGWKKTKYEVLGLTNPLVSTWEYYDLGTPGLGASTKGLGLLKTTTTPSGANTTHIYADNGSAVDHTINSVFSDGSLAATAKVTAYPSGSKTLESSVGGTIVAQAETTWSGNERTGAKTTSGSGVLVAKTTHLPTGSDNGGRITRIDNPDGTATLITITSTPLVHTETTRTGQVDNATGDIILGTQMVETRDEKGIVESHIVTSIDDVHPANAGIALEKRVATNWDALGRITEIEYFNSGSPAWKTYSHYGCCGLEWEMDKYGTKTYYAYDDLHRVTKINRAGVVSETVYDGLTQRNHRYAGAMVGDAWPSAIHTDLNKISYVTRDISGTIVTYYSQKPQGTGFNCQQDSSNCLQK